MASEIIIGMPPNFEEIAVVFPQVKVMSNIIYSWGNKIYNPDNTSISAWLKAHENVHGQRQLKMGVFEWWDKYLRDVDFRFGEEVPAHHTEFRQFCVLNGGARRREAELVSIAERLSGPLYGNMVGYKEARRLVRLGKV